jgi:hypothetical protein
MTLHTPIPLEAFIVNWLRGLRSQRMHAAAFARLFVAVISCGALRALAAVPPPRRWTPT